MAKEVPTRRLGRDGPQVPVQGLGLMGLSAFYGTPPPDEERIKFFDRAHELGNVHWDSAAVYGDSEDLLGRWFQRTGKRNETFLATKFGIAVTPGGGREINNTPEYIRETVNQSLSRLQTDHIDLLYCHQFSGKTPVEDIIETMKEFVDSGKVRYLGLSECGGTDTLRRASKVHPIHAYQIEYSPFSMDIEKPETDLANTCRELGIAIVAYSPLGRGMLTGRYKSADDFEDDDYRRAVADRKGCTPSQLTLAWAAKQSSVFPIPGTKNIKYLEENWGANNVSLTDEEVREIREAIERTEVHGKRAPEAQLGLMLRDTPPRP